MGSNISPNQTPLQNYSFFDNYEDPHFGRCPIHHHIQYPNQFVIVIAQSMPQSDVHTLQKNIKSFVKENSLNEQYQDPFIKIVDFRVQYGGGESPLANHVVGTCKMPEVKLYIQFLRHNFKDFLVWRMIQKQPLTINELIMVLNKTIKAYEMTKSNQFFGPSLNLQDISITIQGEVKFNPLLGKPFLKPIQNQLYISGHNSCQSRTLKERIIDKRLLREDKENISPKFITSREYRYLSQYVSKDNQFLARLKKFGQQILLNSGFEPQNEVKNPQQIQFDQRKEMKRLLSDFQRIKCLSQAKRYLGESKVDRLDVDLAKVKHEESQARFSKILSQIQTRSQKTDYSYHESSQYIAVTPSKILSSNGIQFISPQRYHYS